MDINFFALDFGQTKLSEKYPCQYSSTAMTCVFASIQATIFAMCMERDWSLWKLGWDIRLATVAYTVRWSYF